MSRPFVILLLFASALVSTAVFSELGAQSKTERELMERINRLEFDKREADRAREALEEKVIQAKRTATANRVVATKKVDAVVGAAIVESTAVTQEQVLILEKAARDAKEAADKAEKQASKIVSFANSSFITQLFILLIAVAGYTHHYFKTRAETTETIRKEDRAERYRIEAEKNRLKAVAAVEQIHKLVNSNVTKLMERELKGLESNLASLELLVTVGDGAIATNARASAVIVREQIVALKDELAVRAKETEDAADKVKADLAMISGAEPV